MGLVLKYAMPAAVLLVVVSTLQSFIESRSLGGMAQFFDKGLLSGVVRVFVVYICWLGMLILSEVLPSKLGRREPPRETNLEATLIGYGASPLVARYVAEQGPVRTPVLNAVGGIVTLAGFAVGWFWLLPSLEGQLNRNAVSAAHSAGALLYRYDFGWGLLLGAFAWAHLTTWIAQTVRLLSPRLTAAAFCALVTQSAGKDRIAGFQLQKVLRDLSNEKEGPRYARRALMAWVRHEGVILAILTLASIAMTARDIHAYTLIFADRYEQRSIFAPERTVRYWTDATRVEVGCNHSGNEDAPVYEVHFTGGGSVRLDGASPTSATWLSHMEKIDVGLVSASVRFEPWRALDKDPYDPRCLSAYSARLGEAQALAFQRLIRAPQTTTDIAGDGRP